jgi:hypothetical protein
MRALSEIATRVAMLRSNLSNGERPYRRPGGGSSRRSRGRARSITRPFSRREAPLAHHGEAGHSVRTD